MNGLVNKVGDIAQDNLIARVFPPVDVTGIKIPKGAEETTYKRGTLLSDTDGTVAVMASGENPAYILAEDVTVGTDEDAAAPAYRTGCFNKEAVEEATGYTLTAADEDTLRKYGIVFVDKML